MAVLSWGLKLNEETKDRVDALLQGRIDGGYATTKAEAFEQMLPGMEQAAQEEGSPVVAGNMHAIRESIEVINAQTLAMAKALEQAKTAAASKAQAKLDASARALAESQARVDSLEASVDGLKDQAKAAQRAHEGEVTALKAEIADLTKQRDEAAAGQAKAEKLMENALSINEKQQKATEEQIESLKQQLKESQEHLADRDLPVYD